MGSSENRAERHSEKWSPGCAPIQKLREKRQLHEHPLKRNKCRRKNIKCVYFPKVKFRKSLRKGSLEADNCWPDTDKGSDKRKINCPLTKWRNDVQKSFTSSAVDVCFNADECVTGKHQEKMKSEGMETETGNSKIWAELGFWKQIY